MKTYKLVYMEELFFVEIESGLFLIDTGSPYSYSKNGTIQINDTMYEEHRFDNILSKRMNEFSLRIQKDITGVIGNDILFETGITLDKEHQEVIFDVIEKDIPKYDICVVEEKGQNYIGMNTILLPGIDEVFGKLFIIDTGAPLSFFDKNMFGNVTYSERVVKYYPALGKELQADKFIFPFLANSNSLDLEAALNTSTELKYHMDFVHAEGIISLSQLIANYGVIDFKNKHMYLDNGTKVK